jgi:hypothetical protein
VRPSILSAPNSYCRPGYRSASPAALSFELTSAGGSAGAPAPDGYSQNLPVDVVTCVCPADFSSDAIPHPVIEDHAAGVSLLR